MKSDMPFRHFLRRLSFVFQGLRGFCAPCGPSPLSAGRREREGEGRRRCRPIRGPTAPARSLIQGRRPIANRLFAHSPLCPSMIPSFLFIFPSLLKSIHKNRNQSAKRILQIKRASRFGNNSESIRSGFFLRDRCPGRSCPRPVSPTSERPRLAPSCGPAVCKVKVLKVRYVA